MSWARIDILIFNCAFVHHSFVSVSYVEQRDETMPLAAMLTEAALHIMMHECGM